MPLPVGDVLSEARLSSESIDPNDFSGEVACHILD